MKIIIILTGKTDIDIVKTGWDDYFGRIKRYVSCELMVIPALKNAKNIPVEQQKLLEGKQILTHISGSDYVVLLDESGTTFSSQEFSIYLQQRMNSGIKNLIFIVGGPYGFSADVYQRADFRLSLSKMTFTHQMIRLLFIEQLYRAFTIINNESYHH